MAKRPAKQTLADKQADSGKQPQSAQSAKKAKELKPKSPMPDFKKNLEREAVRKAQESVELTKALAEKASDIAAKERARLPDMVAGVPGTYAVGGYNSKANFVILDFVVKQQWFTAKGDKPAAELLVIQELRPQGGTREPVFFPLGWLLKNPKKVNFAYGEIGDVQEMMFSFLLNNMPKEIAALKALHAKEHQAKNDAKQSGGKAPSCAEGVESMHAVDIAHQAEEGPVISVPVPTGHVDISSMADVDQQHAEELETA